MEQQNIFQAKLQGKPGEGGGRGGQGAPQRVIALKDLTQTLNAQELA